MKEDSIHIASGLALDAVVDEWFGGVERLDSETDADYRNRVADILYLEGSIEHSVLELLRKSNPHIPFNDDLIIGGKTR